MRPSAVKATWALGVSLAFGRMSMTVRPTVSGLAVSTVT
jgi:hypothetical protein